MSSTHPITEGSPEASYVRGTHLPSFILPYIAVVINTTWSGWQWAVKVSQLQYSRSIPDEKKYLSVSAMTVSFSSWWLASAYLFGIPWPDILGFMFRGRNWILPDYVFKTSNPRLVSLLIIKFWNTSAMSHPPILGCRHEYHLAMGTVCFEGFPVTVVPGHI